MVKANIHTVWLPLASLAHSLVLSALSLMCVEREDGTTVD